MKKKLFKIIVIGLTLSSITLWSCYFFQKQNFLSMHFVNVGNGDGILINSPENFKIVIDGGPGDKISNYLGVNFPFSGRDIDLLVVSHPHEDHILGAIDILQQYNVKKILGTGVEYNSPAYDKLLQIAREKKVDFIIGIQGEVLRFGNIDIEVLYPFESIDDNKMTNINNSSLIIRLKYKNFYTLFPGDIEDDTAGKLLLSGVDMRADVVKVAHQGSENGFQNVDKILEAIKPQIAVISVGENRFGHPEDKTLKILSGKNIKVLRTDLDGDVVLESDGEKFWVKN